MKVAVCPPIVPNRMNRRSHWAQPWRLELLMVSHPNLGPPGTLRGVYCFFSPYIWMLAIYLKGLNDDVVGCHSRNKGPCHTSVYLITVDLLLKEMNLFLLVNKILWGCGSQQLDYHCFVFEDVSVKSEDTTSEVIITKEMEEEEKQLMEEGERKEKEMMEKVCFLLISQNVSLFSKKLNRVLGWSVPVTKSEVPKADVSSDSLSHWLVSGYIK